MQFDRLRRGDFITLLGSTAVWLLKGRVQQPGMPMIGFLSSRSPGESRYGGCVLARPTRNGFIEGQNLSIAFRWAEGRYDRLPAPAAELVGLPVTLLFAAGGQQSVIVVLIDMG